MAHKSDVPKNFEIWAGGPNGLRLRRHPKIDQALKYLDEFPMVIRKTSIIDASHLASGEKPRLSLGSFPVFRRSSVGETVELRLEIDCPALTFRGPVQFARVFIETPDTLLEEHVVVKSGKRQFLNLPFPAFESETDFTVSIELRDQPFGIIKQDFTLIPEKRYTFYYAFQTHLDLGWTDRVEPTIESLKKMTSEVAIKVCEQFMYRPDGERFIWTCECSDALRLAWNGANAEQKEKLKDFIRRGLIQCCAFPFSFHAGIMSKDLLKRSIERSHSLRDEIGVGELDLSVAQNNDVPGHSWIVPDVLSEMGIKRAQIGHNSMVRGCKLPPLFMWRGPSGGSVLTLATSCVDYGADFPIPKGASDLYGLSINNPDGFRMPGTAIMRRIGYGENCGPEGAEREMNALAAWNTEFAWPKLIVGSPKDYFEHIENELDISSLPVVDQEISDWWIDGPASMPEAMANYRKAMIALPDLSEKIPVDQKADREKLADIEDNLILHAEHTFGMNAQLVRPTASAQNWTLDGLENYVGSWEDKELYASRAIKATNELKAKFPATTRDGVSENSDWRIDWDNKGIATIADPTGRCWYDRSKLSDAPAFASINQQLLPKELDEWFHHNPAEAPNAGDYPFTLESVEEYKDEKSAGAILTGKLDSPAGKIESVSVKVGNSLVDSDLIIEAKLINKQPTAQAECVTLALPFIVNEARYRTDVGEALMRVDDDQRADANKDEHPVITGWILEDGNTPEKLAISSAEAFLWHLGERRYCSWNNSVEKRDGTAYAHLLNNVWNTNFRCWVGGDLTYTIRIRVVKPNNELTELKQMSALW